MPGDYGATVTTILPSARRLAELDRGEADASRGAE
jgi:hypothetical protein